MLNNPEIYEDGTTRIHWGVAGQNEMEFLCRLDACIEASKHPGATVHNAYDTQLSAEEIAYWLDLGGEITRLVDRYEAMDGVLDVVVDGVLEDIQK